jgi:aspartate-semialdehyde dehydrogenase
MGYKVAVVGATGNVGREMLKTLAERKFPGRRGRRARLRPLGRPSEVSFGEEDVLKVKNLEKFDFKGWDIGCSRRAPRSRPSMRRAPPRPGCVVIDNTSQFRMDPDVPLVVPEVNPPIAGSTASRKRGIIANPELLDHPDGGGAEAAARPAPRSSAWWSRPISRSPAPGKEAMDELFNQTRAVFVNDPIKPEQFTKQIAFNVIPHIDVFMDDGSTKEEWKMAVETKKILDPDIKLTPPACACRCSSAMPRRSTSSSSNPITVEEARAALREAPGIRWSTIARRRLRHAARGAGEDAVCGSAPTTRAATCWRA